MKVFLSWSGENSQSHQVAMALHNWLPSVIQQAKPWLSSQDIKTGSQWQLELDKELTDTRFGIFAMTWESKDKPYLMFEAGALSKYVDESNFVCPYYFGLKSTDVKNPLSSYQGQESSREGTLELIKSINAAMESGSQIEAQRLEQIYDKWWPDLEAKLKDIADSKPSDKEKEVRNPDDMLEEILILTRNIANHSNRYTPPSLLQTQIDTPGRLRDAFNKQMKGEGKGSLDDLKILQERAFRMGDSVLHGEISDAVMLVELTRPAFKT